MTTAEYNALPLEARRFIETHAGCLSCGNAENKLTRAYELYLRNRKMTAYQLKGGGINYMIEETPGALYSIKPDDSASQIREKLRIAALLFEARPEVFLVYDTAAIAELLESLPEEEVIDLTAAAKEAEQAAKEAEEQAAKEAEAPKANTKKTVSKSDESLL